MVVKATVQSADVSTLEVWRANSPQLRELRTESGVSLFDAAEKHPGSEGGGNPEQSMAGWGFQKWRIPQRAGLFHGKSHMNDGWWFGILKLFFHMLGF